MTSIRPRSASLHDVNTLESEAHRPHLRLAPKLVIISVLLLIQFAAAYGKVNDHLNGSWGVFFIPSWVLIAIGFTYTCISWKYYELEQRSISGGCLKISAIGVGYLTAFIFLVVLSVELDSGSVDAASLLMVWLVYSLFLLFSTLCYAIVQKTC